MSRKDLRMLLCVAERYAEEAAKDGAEQGLPPPRVFCKRVWNRLMAKGLGKHSFLKSVEESENRGLKFVRFAAKSEKSGGAEMGREGRE
jgi:hypothetical protein